MIVEVNKKNHHKLLKAMFNNKDKFEFIGKGSSRYVFLNKENNKIIKLVYNKFGLECNNEELKLSKNNLSFLPEINEIIENLLIETDYFKNGNITDDDDFIDLFELNRNKLTAYIELNYFKNKKKRLNLEQINIFNNLEKVFENYYPNKNLSDLNNFVCNNNIEPANVINSIVKCNENTFKIYDFGMTEQIYFNNLFLLQDKKTGKNITLFVKNFDGKYKQKLGKYQQKRYNKKLNNKFNINPKKIIKTYIQNKFQNNILYLETF